MKMLIKYVQILTEDEGQCTGPHTATTLFVQNQCFLCFNAHFLHQRRGWVYRERDRTKNESVLREIFNFSFSTFQIQSCTQQK